MKLRKIGLTSAVTLIGVTMVGSANAQLADVTQITPTVPGGAINKSYVQEIGVGRGNILTEESSAFIISRDPFRAIRRGRQIFQRKFNISQGQAPKTDDGIGNVALVGGDPQPRRRSVRLLRRLPRAARAARRASAATWSRGRTAAMRPTCSAWACRSSSATR